MGRVGEKVMTVAELTRSIKSTLEGGFSRVTVEGEVSNFRRPASGHFYFTIKDETAQISAVMFKGSQGALKFKPSDGVVVRATGGVSVYAPRGSYQIIVRQMEEGGQGSLQARFEALKKRLQEEGLFEKERKKALPLLPQHVGVVTSDTGAAIRDILNVVSRRFPNLHILLAPAKVQGAGAAEEVAAAIDRLNAVGGLDVLIVGRGGGSLEDLWCFNEEVVARAIARSRIPVISAVGHEIDFTISDFVADLRAPTPSAAAELVVGCKDTFVEQLEQYRRRLVQSARERLVASRRRLERVSGSYVFREPANVVARYRQQLDLQKMRCENSLSSAVRDTQQTLDRVDERMHQQLELAVQRGRSELQRVVEVLVHLMKMRHGMGVQDVRRYEMQLRALNPLAVLQRGYSVTRGPDGRIVVKVSDIEPGVKVVTQVSDGSFESEILQIKDS